MTTTIQFTHSAKAAPLGDPVEIKVRGFNLTLRKHEAERILVKVKL